MSFGRFLSSNLNKLLKNTGSYLRYSENEFKDRKYKNIDIQNEFEKLEEYRKNRTLILKKLKAQKEKLKIEGILKIHKILINLENEVKEKNINTDLLYYNKYRSLLDSFDKEKIENLLKNEELKKLNSYKELETFLKNNKIEKLVYNENNKQLKKIEYEVELQNINSNLEKLNEDIKLIKDEEKQLKNDMIILDSFNRDLVLTKLKYYMLQAKDFKNFEIHPEDIKIIEELNYSLNNNLPVNKIELYKIVPDLFTFEISYLSDEKKKIIENNKLKLLPSKESKVDFFNNENESDFDDFEEKLCKKEYQMEEYFYNESVIFSEKFNDLIDQRSKFFGLNIYDYFDYLEYKNYENLDDLDKNLKKEIEKINGIFEDYCKLLEVNQEIIMEYKYRPQIPKYILKNQKLIEIWNKTVEKAKQNFFNIEDTQILPHNFAPKETPMDEEIKKKIGMDLEELEKSNRNEYYDNLELLLNKYKDLGEEYEEKLYEENQKFKEDKKIKTSKILGEALNELYDSEKMTEFNEINLSESYSNLQIDDFIKPKLGNFLNEEFNKALYLNNQDPKKYNLDFFSNYFKIDKKELEYCFVHISYPIKNDDLEVVGYLRFIKI